MKAFGTLNNYLYKLKMQLNRPIELFLKDKLNYPKNLTMKNNISIPSLRTYKQNCNKLKKQQIMQV
jgi:hypothetical protein